MAGPNRFPIHSLSQKEVNAALEKLHQKYESRNLTAMESSAVLSDCITSLGGLFAAVTSTSEPKDWWFYRVRTRSSFTNESDYLKPEQHTYLPANQTTRRGRCHLPGYPVFYGSDSYDGAIDEMRDNRNADYMLSVWKLPNRQIRTLKFLCGSNIEEPGRLVAHKKKILSDACDQHNMHDELNAGRLKSHIVAWSDLFMSPKQALSACIGYQCTYGERKSGHDIIAYGSAIDGSYINFAIPQTVADELVLYKIFHIQKNACSKETTWIAVSEAPLEEWRNVTPEDLPHVDKNIPTGFHPTN